jgi:hypothetical protein
MQRKEGTVYRYNGRREQQSRRDGCVSERFYASTVPIAKKVCLPGLKDL